MNIKRIQILSDAENDLDDGRKFYDKQGENVGNYFWDSLLSDIEPCCRATALSLPDNKALDEGTMAGKPKGRCDI